MEEDKLNKAIDLLISEVKIYDQYYCLATSQALKTVLNELDRLQKENYNLNKESQKYFDILMDKTQEIEELKFKERSRTIGEYGAVEIHDLINQTLSKDYIPKKVIRDKFKRINETKIKSDKTNARNYMIFGDTERATGWFINLDYIEKILLDVPGYEIGDE